MARNGAAAEHLARELIALAPVDAESLRILPHLDMRTADGSLNVGWLASQTDILAEDWSVLP